MHPSLPAYTAQADALHQAADGLSPAQLTAPSPEPALGAWSIQQVIVHILHSDIAATHRMLRVAVEPTPLLIAYDETAHAAKLPYHAIDLRTVCELFRLNRLHAADLLGRLPDEAFERQGVHNQRGLISLGQLVTAYVEHVNHHLGFIARKRQRLAR